MIGRVSTFGLGQTMLSSSLSVQSKYANTAVQQSSGLASTTYGGLGSKASSLLSTEAATAQLETWYTNTGTALDRTESMYSAVGSMVDLLQNYRSTLSSAISSTDTDGLDDTAADLLDDMADLMNLQMDGRYLFAGSNTDTAPVDTSLLSTPSVPSSADTSYYTGDSEEASVRVSGQQSISYGVTADSTGFEKAVRALNVVANASPLDQTALEEAYDLATEALDALIATQSGLSNTAARLETAQSRQTNSISLLESVASDLKEVDTAEVAVKLAQYETQLQASYSALGNLSSLSLVKYL
ncbi:flagellin [Magnetospirillum aberrantis]|uniref:Flagellin n=1 Tax=Magnetospirillum aberrantis SpK TaxID=908842 RepID=A0A7C9UYL1_9PROT|nr:flagellin [Magnetospirillum aberrantis]NFV79674.1 flagellin [Magnetospirillum aberrantis SpK]